jgi:hypothetical protein
MSDQILNKSEKKYACSKRIYFALKEIFWQANNDRDYAKAKFCTFSFPEVYESFIFFRDYLEFSTTY